MKVGIIGSRTLIIPNIGDYLPMDTTEIISNGAEGVGVCAREYALTHGIDLTEIFPHYERYGLAAPMRRNNLIIDQSDMMLIFWDGQSHRTKCVIEQCKQQNKSMRLIYIK